jgi:TRAP-type C4-dicarboxylate transport system permease small subunit
MNSSLAVNMISLGYVAAAYLVFFIGMFAIFIQSIWRLYSVKKQLSKVKNVIAAEKMAKKNNIN